MSRCPQLPFFDPVRKEERPCTSDWKSIHPEKRLHHQSTDRQVLNPVIVRQAGSWYGESDGVASSGKKIDIRILLIGGAGYIGSHILLACIEAGHEVEVLDNLENSSAEAVIRVGKLARRSIVLHRADVRDGEKLDQMLGKVRFDAVMHFAGLKSVNESVKEPLRYYDYNIGGTAALCAAMERHDVTRLVFSSTAAVYGDQPVMPVTETSNLH